MDWLWFILYALGGVIAFYAICRPAALLSSRFAEYPRLRRSVELKLTLCPQHAVGA
jgi:hypothetical protein